MSHLEPKGLDPEGVIANRVAVRSICLKGLPCHLFVFCYIRGLEITKGMCALASVSRALALAQPQISKVTSEFEGFCFLLKVATRGSLQG